MTVSPLELALQQPLAELVHRIHATNHAWKLARDLLGERSPLTLNLRDAKADLQLRLLASYPEACSVELDPAAGEGIAGILLKSPVEGHLDAAHIPVALLGGAGLNGIGGQA